MIVIHKESPKEPKIGEKSGPEPEVRRHILTKKGSLVYMAKERGGKSHKETESVGRSNNIERTRRERLETKGKELEASLGKAEAKTQSGVAKEREALRIKGAPTVPWAEAAVGAG